MNLIANLNINSIESPSKGEGIGGVTSRHLWQHLRLKAVAHSDRVYAPNGAQIHVAQDDQIHAA
jgi:hypothetical protein